MLLGYALSLDESALVGTHGRLFSGAITLVGTHGRLFSGAITLVGTHGRLFSGAITLVGTHGRAYLLCDSSRPCILTDSLSKHVDCLLYTVLFGSILLYFG